MVIINETLLFAWFSYKFGTNGNIIMTMRNFYRKDDIVEAIQALHEARPEELGDVQVRYDSANRLAITAHLEDLMDDIRKLDQLKKMPVVAGKDLDRIPDRQVEDLNRIAQLNRLIDVERKLELYTQVIETNSNEIAELKEKNQERRC